jgi:leucyl aminopeptidase (aminopeptidase T)
VSVQGEVMKWIIQQNKIVDVKGSSAKAQEVRLFLKENDTRRNIAELGIGCNPKAIITGNVLEDEKVGLHIAYGMSTHLGGTVTSDMHEDICYSKGCPVEGTTVTLLNSKGTTTALIQDAMLQYDILQ